MATLNVDVPDALVPRLVAALQGQYPDLTGGPAQIGRQGVRRLLREVLVAHEGRLATEAGDAATLAAAATARTQASTDAGGIT